ncbi:lipase/acyltransferase domain-containing protein [Singulisphaera sp. PoT]|uniref:lipase/acyltransferase domain-containing protein n=1 Tax=Singulisphaera sp. PoT TaxID=3411797 RepID=UPI003BF54B38
MSTQLKNLVVVLPGISGSVLEKDGREVWSPSVGAIGRGLLTGGDSIRSLKINRETGKPDLGDGVVATRLIPDARLIPGLIKIDGYTKLINKLKAAFQIVMLPDGTAGNLLEFPYDWRRDNRVSAAALKDRIDRKLQEWRKVSPKAKTILVGHSMGGIVSRYYLEVLGGWLDCRALITLGTPYRGSLDALGYLANGYKGFSFLGNLTDTIRSFPSSYQLLPRYEAVKVGNSFQRPAETENLPNLDFAMAKDALKFHHEIDEAIEKNKQEEFYDNMLIFPLVGINQPTLQSANFEGGVLTVSEALPEAYDPILSQGDGTVPRLSATPIELSEKQREVFYAERHASLQNHDDLLVHLCAKIEELQRAEGMGNIRGPESGIGSASQPAVSLGLDDLYIADEPVTLRVRVTPDADPEPPVGSIWPVNPIVKPVSGPIAATFVRDKASDGWTAVVPNIVPGVYRVEVSAPGSTGARPVHDVFEVVGKDVVDGQ